MVALKHLPSDELREREETLDVARLGQRQPARNEWVKHMKTCEKGTSREKRQSLGSTCAIRSSRSCYTSSEIMSSAPQGGLNPLASETASRHHLIISSITHDCGVALFTCHAALAHTKTRPFVAPPLCHVNLQKPECEKRTDRRDVR